MSAPGEVDAGRRKPVWASSALWMPWLLVAVGALALHFSAPPRPVPASAPQDAFSAERAMRHVRAIAREPHPLGSPAHAQVREYIVDEMSRLGLQPQTQETTIAGISGWWPARLARVTNIVGRWPGTGKTAKAVMLVAHYDSVSGGPGAGDDASGVAAILEAVRALQAGPPLQNDLIVLITDGEELGLLGAKAFVEEHPWANDAGVVLNFEARGVSGTSVMFETSDDNGILIRDFARAAPHPAGYSLTSAVYKLLPNNTDLTIFKEAGIPSMNFAFVDGSSYYHTRLDDPEHLSAASLQHHGSYALSLVRHFGNREPDAGQMKAADLTYFTVPGIGLVHYSMGMQQALVVAAGVVVLVLVVLALRKGEIRWLRLFAAFLVLPAAVALAAATVAALWAIVTSVHPAYASFLITDPYNRWWYAWGFVAVAACVVTLGAGVLSRRIRAPEWALAAQLLWLNLSIAAIVLLPGAAFLFTVPLLLVSLAWLAYPRLEWLRWASAAAGVWLAVPVLDGLTLGLTLKLGWATVALWSLFIVLWFSAVELFRPGVWRAPVLSFAAVVVVLLVAGSFTSTYDESRPKPNSLLYVLDSDTGKAVWASLDRSPDAWTSLFLGASPPRRRLDEFVPDLPLRFLVADAKPADYPAPELHLVEQKTEGDTRILRLRLQSQRDAAIAELHAPPGRVQKAMVDGKRFESLSMNPLTRPRRSSWSIEYVGLPKEGIDLTLRFDGLEPVEFRVIDQTYGLPLTPRSERPASFMPSFYGTDLTLVTRRVTF
jgi:hypothetical protein